jgi:hydroxymethylbilane synthase
MDEGKRMSEKPEHSLRLGTRKSPLAMWQAEWVRDRLEATHAGLSVELCRIETQGDKILDAALSKIGDKGLFTREIERALLDGEVDLAVHSLKDLPTALPDGLVLGAVCEREAPYDALVSKRARSLEDLPEGATVATSSLRRQSQLLHARPDLQIVDVRGNVGTRLGKLDASNWDALILAQAGLERLGLGERVTAVLDPDVMLPAVSQGALGIEMRAGDAETARWIASLEHPPTRQATRAERAFLRKLEGGCQVPIGALASAKEGVLRLDGLVASIDGARYLRGWLECANGDAARLGVDLADELLDRGAAEILEEIRA